MRRKFYLFALAAIVAVPAAAPAEPNAGTVRPAASQDPVADEAAAVRAVLWQYKNAIERLDARGTEQLFTAGSAIFETGGAEGAYANYLSHHLGPELREFKSFKFSDYKVDVRLLGPAAAHAIETYTYRIVTNTGEVVDRIGVATTVLQKENGQWKIVMMHNSGRKPKGS